MPRSRRAAPVIAAPYNRFSTLPRSTPVYVSYPAETTSLEELTGNRQIVAQEIVMSSRRVSKRNYPWTARVKGAEVKVRLMTLNDVMTHDITGLTV